MLYLSVLTIVLRYYKQLQSRIVIKIINTKKYEYIGSIKSVITLIFRKRFKITQNYKIAYRKIAKYVFNCFKKFLLF